MIDNNNQKMEVDYVQDLDEADLDDEEECEPYSQITDSNLKRLLEDLNSEFVTIVTYLNQNLRIQTDVTDRAYDDLYKVLDDVTPTLDYLENDFVMFHHNGPLYMNARRLENKVTTIVRMLEDFDFLTLCEVIKEEN